MPGSGSKLIKRLTMGGMNNSGMLLLSANIFIMDDLCLFFCPPCQFLTFDLMHKVFDSIVYFVV